MEINAKTRLEILEMSLTLEEMLNGILYDLFKIKKDLPNTLGHKSSAISFKTKVDFLYDLDRIDKNTYNDLVTLMEIRNQFMHNMSANSYATVLDRINKVKRILALVPQKDETDKEFQDANMELIYQLGVNKLFLNILDQLDEVIKKIEVEVKEEKDKLINDEMFKKFINLIDESMIEFAKELSEFYTEEMGEKSEMGQIIVSAIRQKIKKKLNEPRTKVDPKNALG